MLAAVLLLVVALLVSMTSVSASPTPGASAPKGSRIDEPDRVDPVVPTFSDVPPGHAFYSQIRWMAERRVATGYPDGTFRPTESVTRGAMATFLHRYALTKPVADSGPGCIVTPFPDVPTSDPSCTAIAWAADHDIVKGYADGKFHTTALVSRQALAALLVRLEDDALPFDLAPCSSAPFPDIPTSHPFCPEIAWMVEHDIVKGYADGKFHPNAAVSRQAAAAFLAGFDEFFGNAPIPSAGCGTSTQGAVTAEPRTVDVNGLERTYLLTVPTAHDGDEPLPLVVDFHGYGEGAQIHTSMSEMAPIAEREGFVVVYPQGRGSPAFWQVNIAGPNPDLDFTDVLLDEVEADLCLDLTRVYVEGLSNGAFMTSTLGCVRADRFAAIAPVAGAQHPTGCNPSRRVPMLAFHGTADPILFFNGGGGPIGGTTTSTLVPPDLHGPGYPANVAAWAAANGCDPDDTDTNVTDEVIHRVYDCPDEADVEFFIVLDGGHAWPGSAFSAAIASIVGYTTMDIHASEEAWAFFEHFHLPRWTA
jgi:polyhydroxybutyrate depolymerase